MVSRATKRIWQGVALGLALGPVLGIEGVGRAQSMNQAPKAAAARDGNSPLAAKPDPADTVRQLVKQGRLALQQGDKVKAEMLARQAADMRVSLPFWETDTPEKLLRDIGAKSTPAKASTPSKSATPPKATMPTGPDPHLMVKQGFEALRAGRIDDAQRLAQQADLTPNTRWGLFEDTPKKLMDEVKKARAEREKAESINVLTEARKLYDQGKFDDAEKLTYKAESLHGQYSIWDFGDKPAKLRAEIQTAKEKSRRTRVPPVPGTSATAVAANKPAANPNPMQASAVQQASAPPPMWPTEVKTADAKGMTPAASGVTTAAAMTTPGAPSGVVPVGVVAPPAVNEAKVNAQRSMATGKTLQQTGRFLEAREKYKEARGFNAEFAAGEETPDRCLMDLTGIVLNLLDGALRDGSEAKLTQARPLAAGFGLDTQPIDYRLMALKSAPAKPPMPSTPATVAANPMATNPMADAMIEGQKVLDKARLELKKGETEFARTLAIEVLNGPYGLKSEAVNVIRTIDTEERNQRGRAAQRSFDAGMAAYRGNDYLQAQAVLSQIDASLLAPDMQQKLKDTMLACSKATTTVVHAVPPPALIPVMPPPMPVPPVTVMPVPMPAPSGPIMPAPMPAPSGPIMPAPMPAPQMPPPVVTAVVQGAPAGAVAPASGQGITGLQGPRPAMAAPSPTVAAPIVQGEGDSLIAQQRAMRDIEYQKLREESFTVLSDSRKQFDRGETDAALETLQAYLKRVKNSKLDSVDVARLQRAVEDRMRTFQDFKAQKDAETKIVGSRRQFTDAKSREMLAEQKKQQQVKDLMKQFNQFYKEGRYKEAEIAAAKAHELDPDDETIAAAVQMSQMHGNLDSYATVQKRKEDMFRRGLNDAENMGPAVDLQNPIAFDKDPVRIKYAQNRSRDKNGVEMRTYSEKDREVHAKLSRPVSVVFRNAPLRAVLHDLQKMTGVNIDLAEEKLADEAINAELPISVDFEDISLKSVLKVIVERAHLTYITEDGIVKVTTERAARGKLVPRVFPVADLVIPIDDYMVPLSSNTNATLERLIHQQAANLGGGGTPYTGRNTLQQGQSVGNSSNTGTLTARDTLPSTSVQSGSAGSAMSYSASVVPTKQTMQDKLISLIHNVISPNSWSDVGGSGTIEYMPIGLALVINQTPDVQEQVADLLETLRRLQDLEVAVEVRMITLAETFFERIGLDFALNIKTDKSTSQFEPALTTGNFKPAGQVNDFSPGRFLTGLQPSSSGPPGVFTSDLDIPIKATSFQYAIPPFGGYPNSPGNNGGLSLGLAFLSDIQVFMFMEAAQGDRRTNVMQAPKLTLFNGQTATISVNDQQFFVTSVTVTGFGGQIVFTPTNTPIPLGVNLTIQAVVSADRRFVRLNITPTLTNLASAIVPLFPVTTFITPVFEGGAQGQPVPFTQFIQQPAIATVTIQTTVSIPDGGTVILGGLKTLSEGRNEFGPPVISKIPYLNRLVKNVGYGREAQSLLLMVTPRIIINSEEEERQTGLISAPAIQQ